MERHGGTLAGRQTYSQEVTSSILGHSGAM